MNVTIPYKESIIEYLNYIDPIAKKIGAVNTIKIDKKNKLSGYNTDYIGFKKTLNNKNLSNFHFPKINQINISGLDDQENSEILKILEVFKSDNLFFLGPKKIEKMINNISYIDEFFISKKYPTTLNVKIQKAKHMAYTIKDNKTFILGSNKKLIVASDMKEKLPYI